MISLYVNVNENGTIIESLSGSSVIPSKQYDFFFYVFEDVASNISKYKVVLNGMLPELVLINSAN